MVFDPKLKYKTSKFKDIRADQRGDTTTRRQYFTARFVGGTWRSFLESSGKCLIVGKLPYSIIWDYTFQKKTRTRERNWRMSLYAQVMMSISNKMGSL